MTDAEKIIAQNEQILSELEATNQRLDLYREALNGTGENVAWLVQNLQGLFQMFASPQFMSQMSNMLTGAVGNAGQPGPEAGTDTGTES